ncbi:Glycosyltransferase involved in cell wall bisynthesis [Soonwooa buanensis]|uniref:Glycosyltransferase involved in cell wall bisynthesis n=1 Tax=Soonwooa buanensis TaxID=619805 RepID=A0A1T5EB72_9FLAO|nr:glycosyltransferase [Soonwooa buanensis]SKB81287.1 Glycosyltransferase involved in cell wall bisynthesis [Soonwooa buanensis]
MSPKKILAVTLGGTEYPSSNFRLRQYYPLLEQNGYEVTEFNSKRVSIPNYPNIIGVRGLLRRVGYKNINKKYYLNKFKKQVEQADIIWVNKLLRDTELINIVKASGKVLVVDFDDAEWLSSTYLFNKTLEIATQAIAGNNYLANYARTQYKLETEIIPTTIDVKSYPKQKKHINDDKFIIGWLGSHFTNEYLLLIQKPLNEFLENTKSEFHIISSKHDFLKEHFPKNTKIINWDESTFIDEVANFNIGLMPLPNEEWVKGKCSFKMLQYMAAHVPVVVSPLGMNNEILEQTNCGFGANSAKEWSDSFYKFYENKNLQLEAGNAGRKLIEKEFDLISNFQKLKNIFDKFNV